MSDSRVSRPRGEKKRQDGCGCLPETRHLGAAADCSKKTRCWPRVRQRPSQKGLDDVRAGIKILHKFLLGAPRFSTQISLARGGDSSNESDAISDGRSRRAVEMTRRRSTPNHGPVRGCGKKRWLRLRRFGGVWDRRRISGTSCRDHTTKSKKIRNPYKRTVEARGKKRISIIV